MAFPPINRNFTDFNYHFSRFCDFLLIKETNYWINKFLFKHKKDLVLIYFPTIKIQMQFSKKLKEKHYIINSKITNRKKMLDKLHDLNKGIILTTLVLERGITFKNCHVIVYNADHHLFSYENLKI